MQPLTRQYNKILLEETDLYITKKLKNLAEDKAKTRGQEQIDNAKLLHNDAETQTQQPAAVQRSETQAQQPEEVPSGISRSASQAASNLANPEQLDRSSDTYTISSENFGETADNLPLLDKNK